MKKRKTKTQIKPTKKQIHKAILKVEKKADKEWSLAVRTRDKFTCQRCGYHHPRGKSLNGAHIISRDNSKLRWNVNNGICLCISCHRWWAHTHPVEFTYWVAKKIGWDKLENLYEYAYGKEE